MSKLAIILCVILYVSVANADLRHKVKSLKKNKINEIDSTIIRVTAELQPFLELTAATVTDLLQKPVTRVNEQVNGLQKVKHEVNELTGQANGTDVTECAKLAPNVDELSLEFIETANKCITQTRKIALLYAETITNITIDVMNNLDKIRKKASMCGTDVNGQASPLKTKACLEQAAGEAFNVGTNNLPVMILKIQKIIYKLGTLSPAVLSCVPENEFMATYGRIEKCIQEKIAIEKLKKIKINQIDLGIIKMTDKFPPLLRITNETVMELEQKHVKTVSDQVNDLQKVKDEVNKLTGQAKGVNLTECTKLAPNVDDLALNFIDTVRKCVNQTQIIARLYVGIAHNVTEDGLNNLAEIKEEASLCSDEKAVLEAFTCAEQAAEDADDEVSATIVEIEEINSRLKTLSPSVLDCAPKNEFVDIYRKIGKCIREKIETATVVNGTADNSTTKGDNTTNESTTTDDFFDKNIFEIDNTTEDATTEDIPPTVSSDTQTNDATALVVSEDDAFLSGPLFNLEEESEEKKAIK